MWRWLKDSKRVNYVSVTDKEALKAFYYLTEKGKGKGKEGDEKGKEKGAGEKKKDEKKVKDRAN